MTVISICIAIVITIVVTIWSAEDKFEHDVMTKYLLGTINSLQITICNYIYIYVAYYLNEFENHRLQSAFDNHLGKSKNISKN